MIIYLYRAILELILKGKKHNINSVDTLSNTHTHTHFSCQQKHKNVNQCFVEGLLVCIEGNFYLEKVHESFLSLSIIIISHSTHL